MPRLVKINNSKNRLLEHISYSALKVWNECPHKHKLIYIDRNKRFVGNLHTAFGKAVHDACELVLRGASDIEDKFASCFEKELMALDKEVFHELDQETVTEFEQQGKEILPLIMGSLKDYFGDFTLSRTEEDLFERITEYEDYDRRFKGYIDLVLNTPDGKTHIIDWKTCSWGWKQERKNEAITTYQLTLYKHFYARKHNIDPDTIETHFALLKRTANKNKVELFRVSSGNKKTNNALTLLDKALYNIDSGNYLKNKLSCNYCEFRKTEDCP